MPLPNPPAEICLILDGPPSLAKSHLAETLQDVLLAFGYQVAADPLHGFTTPAALRMKGADMPVIRIVEHEETEAAIYAEVGDGPG